MEPLPYDDFLVSQFDRARRVDSIVALAEKKQFTRVLKAAKFKGVPSSILENYVERLQSAHKIQHNEQPWISIFAIFETKDRDSDAFHWVVESEPGNLALDDFGNIYYSPKLTTHALFTDRENLRSKLRDRNILIGFLLIVLLLFVFKSIIGSTDA